MMANQVVKEVDTKWRTRRWHWVVEGLCTSSAMAVPFSGDLAYAPPRLCLTRSRHSQRLCSLY